MNKKITARGHCLCSKISYECTNEPRWRLYCHCASCRRNTASPVTAFFGMANEDYRWTGGETAKFESSKGVKRHFCKNCGTPIAFEADHYPGEIHFYTSGLENTDGFEPTAHVHNDERLPWFDVDDALPRSKAFYGNDALNAE